MTRTLLEISPPFVVVTKPGAAARSRGIDFADAEERGAVKACLAAAVVYSSFVKALLSTLMVQSMAEASGSRVAVEPACLIGL